MKDILVIDTYIFNELPSALTLLSYSISTSRYPSSFFFLPTSILSFQSLSSLCLFSLSSPSCRPSPSPLPALFISSLSLSFLLPFASPLPLSLSHSLPPPSPLYFFFSFISPLPFPFLSPLFLPFTLICPFLFLSFSSLFTFLFYPLSFSSPFSTHIAHFCPLSPLHPSYPALLPSPIPITMFLLHIFVYHCV